MSDAARPLTALADELQAVLAGLERARRTLGESDPADFAELWPRLDRCTRHVEALDRREREGVKPIMLALLDELERTIAAFGAEHRDLGERLKSANRSMTAGAAYRRTDIR